MKKFLGNKILYDRRVLEKDIPLLDKPVLKKIRKAIENKLTIAPEIYGEPLRGFLHPKWKLRVGDWRIVYSIKDKIVTVHAIDHRRNIYKNII